MAVRRCAWVLAIMVIAEGFLTPALAENPEWQPALEYQLMTEENCQLLFMTKVREFSVENRKAVEARVHCSDGRDFDVSRADEGELFAIRACAETTC